MKDSPLGVATPVVTVGGVAIDPSAVHESYQWYRTGVAIPAAQGGTQSTYTPGTLDVGKGISVSVRVKSDGYLPITTLSPRTQLVGSATSFIPGADGQFHVVVQPDGLGALDASSTSGGGDGISAAVTRTYQWYRDAAPIVGATKFNYKLTSADYEKHVWVREVASLAGYTPVVKESVGINYSVHATGTLSVTGTARVGQTLGVTSLAYSTDAGPIDNGDILFGYQWLRSGVAIPPSQGGANLDGTYTLVAADYGKVISVRVTAPQGGYLSAIRTSTASAAVVKGIIQIGAVTQPQVTALAPVSPLASPVLKASWPIDELGTAPTYVWYRNGVAISGATHDTYQLAAVDVSKLISVRVTRTKLNYTTVTAVSVPTDYTVLASGPAVLDASAGVIVGNTLGVLPRTFTAAGVDVSGDVEPAFQWFRNAVAIAGAIDPSYTLQAADVGKTITVRVATTLAGHTPSISTTAASFPVATTLLDGWNTPANVIVTKTGTTTVVLHAGAAGVTVPAANQPLPPAAPLVAPTTAYQWYRGAAAIAAAIHPTYTLVAADAGQNIWVREIVTHAASGATSFATVLKTSAPRNYTVTASGLPTLDDTTPTRNVAVNAVFASTYTLPADDSGPAGVTIPDPLDPSVSFQWYRSGVAISGATRQAYTPGALDKGKRLSVRVIVRNNGYLASIATSAASALIP